jgi:ammonium transporter Rh
MVGSVFLWMFWPSFNGALAADGAQQNRVFCNTNLSIAAGCMGAAFTARLFYGKLEMTIIMNATLAGGVAIGTCSDIITSPAGAMWVGFIAGILSAVGFEKIGPYLEGKINLQDTCGVGSLHGMPGLMGGIASIFAVAICADQFNSDYFPCMIKGTKTDQVMAQVYMILVTFLFAGIAGYGTGFFCRTGMFAQPNVLFKDDDHFHDVVERYPESYKDLSAEKKDE